MRRMKIILTGATGFVGEGILLECLKDERVEKVLSISRKPCGHKHEKLEELITKDLLQLPEGDERLQGYDAMLYCAGISANGLSEQQYRPVTYDIPLHLAQILPDKEQMTYVYLSGAGTTADSKMMWARVKAETENAIFAMPFKHTYALRPTIMKPSKGQLHVKKLDRIYLLFYPLMRLMNQANPLSEIGRAVINVLGNGCDKEILESKDFRILSK